MPTETAFKYLNEVRFMTLSNWSVGAILNDKVLYKDGFKLEPIGNLIIRNREKEILEDDKAYKQVTIKLYGKGVVQRGEELIFGKDISTKNQFRISEGQFIMSKIDARNGAFGIVPADLEGAITTQDFLSYNINTEKILPEFFNLITGTKYFAELCQKASSGTTGRQRVDEKAFLGFKIPVPDKDLQLTWVNDFQSKTAKSIRLETSALTAIKDLEKYQSEKLGISVNKNEKKKGLYFVNLKSLNRWDVWNKSIEYHSGSYELLPLKALIKLQSGKFLPKSKQKAGDYIVYGGNGPTGSHDEYIFSGKRIVIGRVGEYCGNVHLIDGEYWITDNAFKVDKLSEAVTWEYLEIALKTLQLNNFRVQSAQPSIAQGTILNLSIPVPNLAMQKEIANYVHAQRTKINSDLEKSEYLKVEAIKEFESAIFNIRLK